MLQSTGSQRVRHDLGTEQHHIFFIHSCELLDCFHVLAIANSAAVNTGVRISFQMMTFSDICPGVGLPNDMVVLYLVFVVVVFHLFLLVGG